MKLETLLSLRDEMQGRFDEQTRIKTEAEQEQLKLQGEYRLIERLIDTFDPKTDKPKKEGKK